MFSGERMNLLKWFRTHKSFSNVAALLFIMIPSAGLFIAANHDAVQWIWVGISLVVLGNFIALIPK